MRDRRPVHRLHASTSRSRATATSSRRPSATRSRSRPSRRCGSPASTSARSSTRAPPGATRPSASPSTTTASPVTEDALVKIRPRIFLEGNYFLDLDPGSPSAPELASGGDDPGHPHRDRGSVRRDPHRAPGAAAQRARAPAGGLRHGAHPQADGGGGRDPGSCGPGQERRRRRSTAPSTTAARPGAPAPQVAEAFLGTEPDDLAPADLRLGAARSPRSRSHEEQLRDLVSNWNTFTGALAAESENLGRTFDELAPTLETTAHLARQPEPDAAGAAPLGDRVPPAVAELPATIAAANPWLDQAEPLLSKPEAGGLVELVRACHPRSRRRAARPGSAPCRRSTSSAAAPATSSSRPATR